MNFVPAPSSSPFPLSSCLRLSSRLLRPRSIHRSRLQTQRSPLKKIREVRTSWNTGSIETNAPAGDQSAPRAHWTKLIIFMTLHDEMAVQKMRCLRPSISRRAFAVSHLSHPSLCLVLLTVLPTRPVP